MKHKLILEKVSISSLLRASESVDDVLAQPFSIYIRDAAIKRFEYTFELTWKVLKKILAVKGMEVNSPRDVFREAAKDKLIVNLDKWFLYLEKRNLTSHVYKEEVAREVYSVISDFANDVRGVISRLNNL
jgi:nucleotidyltransferase substrate binding protein (TIGR01987 family)